MTRRILLILPLLVGGAIVNVAVAWGFAAVNRPIDYFGWLNGIETGFWFTQGRIESTCLDVPGETRLRQERKHWHGTGIMPRWWEGPDALAERNRHIPRWSLFREGEPLERLRAQGDSRDLIYIERATGWPMLSLRYVDVLHYQDYQTSRVASKGLLLVPWKGNAMRRDYPYWPIAPGFAMNTVFYATILWMLFTAPFALRRRRRIKCGLCPKCAYDLRGRPESAACPECGAAVKSAVSRNDPASDVHLS